ncbi:MAG: hypothetical protein HC877_24245 [Thioploca sp.]|nr:hypothetical protein [Thioploca sp.]
MNIDLNQSTIFLVKSGSHAYGFATEESDHDYRGIAIPPLRCYIGLIDKFEHAVGKNIYEHFPIGLFEDDPRVSGASQDKFPDIQIYELTKFVMLALQNNPSIIEILFTDESDWIRCHPIMNRLLEKRDLILTKQAKARFCGYAFQQLKRVKNHRRWILNPIEKMPERSDFDLPERSLIPNDQFGALDSLIDKQIEGFILNQDDLPEHVKIELATGLSKMMRAVWVALNPERPYPIDDDGGYASTQEALKQGILYQQGFSYNFIELINKEKKYRNALSDWNSYQKWLKERNPKRAKMEQKLTYDPKHCTHLIRLIRMAKEILEDGKVYVKRPDAEELLAIRNGAWSYEQIIEYAEKYDNELEEIKNKSKLPLKPPVKEFDILVREMVLEFNKGNKK